MTGIGLFVVIMTILAFTGFITSVKETSQSTEEEFQEWKEDLDLIQEFDKYSTKKEELFEIFDKSGKKYTSHYETWEDVENKDYDKKIEWEWELIHLQEDKILNLKVYIDHLDSYYEFVSNNEEFLKGNGFDTFDIKQHTREYIVKWNNLVESYESSIEDSKEMLDLYYQLKLLKV